VKSGGLGIRTAEEVALPAFVASRVAVRPIVQDIFAKLEAAGLVPVGHLIGWYDERTLKATHALQAQFPEHANERDAIRTVVQQGAVAAEDWWSRAVQSDLVDVVMQEGHRPAGATLVDEDPPGEAEQSRPGAPAIQRKLSLLLDRFKLDTLMEELADAGEEEDLRRLEDLRDTHQDHSWQFSLNPATDIVLPEDEWLTAVRLRLGCSVVHSESLCASCGECVLDRRGYHALCCSRAEATKGHNRVRDVMHAGCAVSDPGAATEVQGLIPSAPTLRPADILTIAMHETSIVAVDVGIKAPHAMDAGQDCTETMKQQKMRRYGPYLHEPQQQGIRFAPAIFSGFGRRHADTTKMMTLAAQRAARYRGMSKHHGLLDRWCRSVAAEIWRKAARMVHACLQKTGPYGDYPVTGAGASDAKLAGDEELEDPVSSGQSCKPRRPRGRLCRGCD
jgi:hypothetical protein